jgi:hypothetical protein
VQPATGSLGAGTSAASSGAASTEEALADAGEAGADQQGREFTAGSPPSPEQPPTMPGGGSPTSVRDDRSDSRTDQVDGSNSPLEELEDRYRPRPSGKRVPVIDFNPTRQPPPDGYSVELFIQHYRKYRHDPERCVRDIGHIVTWGDGSDDEIAVFRDATGHSHAAVRAAGATGMLNYRKQVDASFRQLFAAHIELQMRPDRVAAGLGEFSGQVMAAYGDELVPPATEFLRSATDPVEKVILMRVLAAIAAKQPAAVEAIVPFLNDRQVAVLPNGTMSVAGAAIVSLAIAGKSAESAIGRLQQLADDPRESDSLRKEAAEAIQVIRGDKPLPRSVRTTGKLLDD